MPDTLVPQPALIMVRGLPGSGKSYLASAIQSTIGTDQVTILDPDHIDKQSSAYKQLSNDLTQQGVDPKFFPNRFLKTQGYEAIMAGKVIIWNQAFTDLDGFTRSSGSLKDFAADHNINLPMLVVEVVIDPETAKTRIAQRAAAGKHDVSEENFTRFIRDYTSFADKGFHTITIDGNRDVTTSVNAVLESLQKLA